MWIGYMLMTAAFAVATPIVSWWMGRDWENDAAPRKKRWLSILWPWIAAGALLGLMSGAIFFLMGTAALQQGERELGTGYIALATIFPPGTIAAAWWMGKD